MKSVHRPSTDIWLETEVTVLELLENASAFRGKILQKFLGENKIEQIKFHIAKIF